jgi:internalin A
MMSQSQNSYMETNLSESEQRIQDTLESGAVELDLSGLGLTTVPEAIASLTNLQWLSLSGNQLTSVPEAIASLTNLQSLYLFDNQLTSVPEAIASLTNLQLLNLSFNQLTSVPEAIATLTNLQSLYLDNNQLTSLPEAIASLTNLQLLNLSFNQLTSVPEAIANLTNLQSLDLESNQLMSLPEGIKLLTQLQRLYLHDNDGLNLPREILGDSWQGNHPAKPAEILDYYFRTRQGQKRPLNEAKLILVGYGTVGKTSLVNRLIHNTFDKNSLQTQGIQITAWPLQLNGNEDVRLNIWDFGGQEIMHATHQFFLTERSLYLLVLNGRQGHEDTDAEYWLNLIQSFGKDSPVIIVLNKIKACSFDLNRRDLRQKFPNIVDFIETDCELDPNGYGIETLRGAIERETDRLEHLRDAFPDSWFGIKDQLATMPQNYISFEQYRTLCANQGETNPQAQDTLAYALHSLGIVLNYKNDRRLQDTHVLNPHWVTQGIYTLLTSNTVAQQKGELQVSDLAKLLPLDDYPCDRHPFLIDLMQKFELCVPFPDGDGRYLIPQLLDKQQPPAAEDFDPLDCLNFQYHYRTIPEGLLPRFIVRTHAHSTQQPRWRTGVILEFDGARALVKADIPAKKVYISITESPTSQRSLLAIIRSHFDHIHRSFSFQPEAMVPVPGYPDILIAYEELRTLERDGVQEFPKSLDGKTQFLTVAKLLNNIELKITPEPDSGRSPRYDLRGATIGNWAENQNGSQQTELSHSLQPRPIHPRHQKHTKPQASP